MTTPHHAAAGGRQARLPDHAEWRPEEQRRAEPGAGGGVRHERHLAHGGRGHRHLRHGPHPLPGGLRLHGLAGHRAGAGAVAVENVLQELRGRRVEMRAVGTSSG